MKSEGRIPISEFSRLDQNLEIQVGDSLKVFIDKLDGINGETSSDLQKRAWGNISSRSNSKILEIRSSGDRYRNCYFALASSLGHDYYYVLSKNIDNDLHSGNVSVNTYKLGDTIKKMIETY